MLGVDTRRAKTLAFAISAIFPGLAGGAYASWTHYIEPPDVFDVLLSVKPLVMVLLGGLGTVFGPVIGAALLLLFEEAVWRSFLTLHAAVLGVIIVVLVLFLPNGLMDAVRRLVGRRGRGAA
jgi:branched-chain amino acid transport system permease protein